MIELAPYPIERVEIPFEGAELQCNFHMLKGRPKAPAVIFVPGCDMTKEIYPDPRINHALDRGMHLLSMDGPGQGMSNLRGTKLTADNYERAVIAVAKWLQARKEVDPDKITVFSQSMDWIVDALASKFKPGHARKMYLRTGGGGPHGTQGEDQDSMHWWVK